MDRLLSDLSPARLRAHPVARSCGFRWTILRVERPHPCRQAGGTDEPHRPRRARFPTEIVPVTTTPIPCNVNTRSIASRKRDAPNGNRADFAA